MQVREFMTKDVSYCDPATNAATAAELMWDRNCGALPVVENGGRVAGIVTDRDLFIALGTQNRLPADLRVGEVMTPDPVLCSPEDDIETALHTMAEWQVRRLPVVDKTGALRGILSLHDIALHSDANGLSNQDILRTVKAILAHQIGHGTAKFQTPARSVA